MSAADPRWQYRLVAIDDDVAEVDANMEQWAEAGWELISGSASSWVSKPHDSDLKTWHIRYAMYWRKPRRKADLSDSGASSASATGKKLEQRQGESHRHGGRQRVDEEEEQVER